MEYFIGLLAICILFGCILALVVPILLELMVMLIGFIVHCVVVALGFVLKGIGLGLRFLGLKIWGGIAAAFLFLRFLIQECFRGPEYQDEHEEYDEEYTREDAYEAALALFELAPGFTRKAFDRAYWAAMKRAHPDVGGSTQEAQELNAARDLIMNAHGWA